MRTFNINFIDEDHIFIDGTQFISLSKVNEMVANAKKKETNLERLHSMSIGEMAQFLALSFDCSRDCPAYNTCTGVCAESLAKWLHQEAKE